MQLTVTRALKELKVLDKRINDKLIAIRFLDVEQKKYAGKALETQKTVEEFSKGARADYQSVNDLIKRRSAMKAAINHANAVTKVKVVGEEMSVAEAIDGKFSIKFKENLLKEMRKQRDHFRRVISDARSKIDEKVDQMISLNTGKDRKVDKEDFDKIAKPFIEANYLDLVDPVKLDEEIDKLADYIEKFNSDVDIALSEVNATTTIEVPE